MEWNRKRNTTETTIKITGPTLKGINDNIDKILQIYRCIVSPIRPGDNESFFVYLTIIGEVEE